MTRTVEIDERYILRVLEEMIRIDSVLPREERIARYIADRITEIGVDPEIVEVEPGRPNVCASFGPAGGRPFLVFSGHSDTVGPADGWETDPFEPVVGEGRLYGLGAINMKAGLACMLASFKAIVESGDSGGRIGFAVTVDQEGMSAGADALLETEYGRCDAMLHAEHFHGDSEADYLPSAVTGKVLYRLVVRGRAAHAFRPSEGGVNAIDDAARIVNALDRLPLGRHESLGEGTICVLKIDGGPKQYSAVVPERCEIVVTRLIVPGETRKSAVREMEELIESLDLASTVTVETPPPYYDPYFLDLETPLLSDFREVYGRVIGVEPRFAGHRGVVDANIFTGRAKIPTIVFGPKGGGHHRAGEYVEIASLAPTARVLAETAARFLAHR